MMLMPQYSIRWCKNPRCAKSVGTAYPHAMACPYCGDEWPDVTAGWPHVCASGHGAQHAGECQECLACAEAKRNVKNGKAPGRDSDAPQGGTSGNGLLQERNNQNGGAK